MNIYPVMNARCEYPTNLNKRCNKPENSNPSFGAVISDTQIPKVLNMLKNKVSDVKVLEDMSGIQDISGTLMKKYGPFGIKSVGAMLIPEEHLAAFVNKDLCADINDYRGLCVAVGDKYGPVETWNRCYQAIVALIPKSKLS